MLAASFYTATKTRGPVIDIERIQGGERKHVAMHYVADKRAARKLAASLGAQPWNF